MAPGGDVTETLCNEDKLPGEDALLSSPDQPSDSTPLLDGQDEISNVDDQGVDVETSAEGNTEASEDMNTSKEDTPSVELKDEASSDVNINIQIEDMANGVRTIASGLATPNLVTQMINMGPNVARAAARNLRTINKDSGAPAQHNRTQMKIKAANDATSNVPRAADQNRIAQIIKASNDANSIVSMPAAKNFIMNELSEMENTATSDNSGTDTAMEAEDNFSGAAADENDPSQETEMANEDGENVPGDVDGENDPSQMTDMANEDGENDSGGVDDENDLSQETEMANEDGENIPGDVDDENFLTPFTDMTGVDDAACAQSVLSLVKDMAGKAGGHFSGATAQEDAMNRVNELNTERSSSVAASTVESIGAVSEQSYASQGGARESATGVGSGTFTPQEDAANLYKALKGSGCDVGSIVSILAHRNRRHRSLILKEYRDTYNEELIARLSSELSTLGKGNIKETFGVDVTLNSTGALSSTFSTNIKRALTLWMLEQDECDATIVKNGLSVLSPNLSAVTEVLCSRTPSQLENLQRAYFTCFKSQLTDDIASVTSIVFGIHKQLLLACLSGERTNIDLRKTEKNKEDADADAKKLFEAGEGKWGTNQRAFIDIFALRSRSHLATVDSAYCRLYNHTLEMVVEKKTSGYFKDGLLTLLKCAKSTPKYFSEVIHKSIKGGLTTNAGALTRAVVTRAEIDMEEIKQEYEKAYKRSLKEAIDSATAGDYRTFLVSIINTKAIV